MGEQIHVCASKRKQVCLLCYEAVSVMKEYNLCQNSDTKHEAKYPKISLQERHQIVQEL